MLLAGDGQRGFAWTRAVLGLPANEIHVAGDLSAIELVRKMCAECGDEFEVRFYRGLDRAAVFQLRFHLHIVTL